ncbi:hypothetical protein INT45_009088 [Circinella minor]|uniref:Uncharacterized protein n=1 Tax=Circinella minor TaxID=1195481 RepID=A0A8H7RFE9_9FUNG|nr:hypothetical protein INT45_009088 [Circinella minor]
MLTLGQASYLVLGYKINAENRQKAKKQLQTCGLLAIHIREQDPLRPIAIGQEVFERDPFTFITYPSTPTLVPTDPVSCDDNNVDQINFDLDNNNRDSSSNESSNKYTDNDNDNDVNKNNHYNSSNHNDDNKSSNTDNSDNNHKNNNNNDHDTEHVNNDKKNNHGTKNIATRKRKKGKNIVPFCKERLLHIMGSIATTNKPSDTDNYNYVYMTTEAQHELMKEFFPDLEQYGMTDRLQYWIGQSNIWGPRKRITEHGERKYGRHLWIIVKEMREFLVESTDSITAYWDHLKNEIDYITIGYARKSPTKEDDASRTRLLQLMTDKLYFRMKCEEVYVSPQCFANEPILERDSPPLDHFYSSIKDCNGGITDLTKRIHYTQKNIRLAIIDYAGLSTSPNDVRNFFKTYPNIKEIAIDHGKSIEILTQYQILESSDAEKFNCRSSLVKRSK